MNQDSLNEGTTDDVIRLNPNFVNVDDPIGPDGIWFTADDGLRLQEDSPAIDSSNWMYFQSGHDNPRFYHYGTKEWMTLE